MLIFQEKVSAFLFVHILFCNKKQTFAQKQLVVRRYLLLIGCFT